MSFRTNSPRWYFSRFHPESGRRPITVWRRVFSFRRTVADLLSLTFNLPPIASFALTRSRLLLGRKQVWRQRKQDSSQEVC